MRCLVMRGLAKEIEDELNDFLAAHDVDVFRMTQGAHGECIALTLLYEERTPPEREWAAAKSEAVELRFPNNCASSRERTRDALEDLARPQEFDVAEPGEGG